MERINSGIEGFDNLVEGGFPLGSNILLSGSPGTGKTIFALQFLNDGLKKEEDCLFISFGQKKESLKEQGRQFGFDVENHNLNFLNISSIEAGKFLKNNLKLTDHIIREELNISENIKNPKRIVVDSLSELAIYGKSYFRSENIKEIIYDVIRGLNQEDRVVLYTSELSQSSDYLSRDTASEFACDGIIKLLAMEGLGKRTLTVKKMRCTKHEITPKTIKITEKGIIVETE